MHLTPVTGIVITPKTVVTESSSVGHPSKQHETRGPAKHVTDAQSRGSLLWVFVQRETAHASALGSDGSRELTPGDREANARLAQNGLRRAPGFLRTSGLSSAKALKGSLQPNSIHELCPATRAAMLESLGLSRSRRWARHGCLPWAPPVRFPDKLPGCGMLRLTWWHYLISYQAAVWDVVPTIC